MKCPSCASNIPDYAGFCAFCGQSVDRCAECGRVYGDAEFCGHCGHAIGSDEPAFQRNQAPDRSAAIFRTSPGRPGSEAALGRPTFVLPAEAQERDPDIYGFLYEPDKPAHRFRLKRGDNTLGAGHNNDIVLDQPAISWNHALLICRNAKIFLQDSASTNGTFVNGRRIDRPCQLETDDAVRFGNVTLHVWLKAKYRQ